MAMSSAPVPQTYGTDKAFPWWKIDQCEKEQTMTASLPPTKMNETCLLALLFTLNPCPCSLVYNKPAPLIQMYAVNSHSFLDAGVFLSLPLTQSQFSVCVCDFFSPYCSSYANPKAMQIVAEGKAGFRGHGLI